MGYSVIVALTGLPIGYSVIIALTGLPIGHSVIITLTGLPIRRIHCTFTIYVHIYKYTYVRNLQFS